MLRLLCLVWESWVTALQTRSFVHVLTHVPTYLCYDVWEELQLQSFSYRILACSWMAVCPFWRSFMASMFLPCVSQSGWVPAASNQCDGHEVLLASSASRCVSCQVQVPETEPDPCGLLLGLPTTWHWCCVMSLSPIYPSCTPPSQLRAQLCIHSDRRGKEEGNKTRTELPVYFI